MNDQYAQVVSCVKMRTNIYCVDFVGLMPFAIYCLLNFAYINTPKMLLVTFSISIHRCERRRKLNFNWNHLTKEKIIINNLLGRRLYVQNGHFLALPAVSLIRWHDRCHCVVRHGPLSNGIELNTELRSTFTDWCDLIPIMLCVCVCVNALLPYAVLYMNLNMQLKIRLSGVDVQHSMGT